MTTRARYREKRRILYDSDVNIGRFLEDKRNLRLVSKAFNQAFLDNLKCADAQELQGMHKEPEPCRNTARVVYSKGMGMQRAIMCAIMSPDNTMHVYVDQRDLDNFLSSKSVKCFDKHYALSLALLYHRDPTTRKYPQTQPPQPEGLRCAGGFHPLKVTETVGSKDGAEAVRLTWGGVDEIGSYYTENNLIQLLNVSTVKSIGQGAFVNCTALVLRPTAAEKYWESVANEQQK